MNLIRNALLAALAIAAASSSSPAFAADAPAASDIAANPALLSGTRWMMALPKESDCEVPPDELFRADDPSWTDHCVTDGCFLYRTKGGKLLMIWSNWDKAGYAVGIAESESGLVTGPWVQKDELLYSKDYTGEYDGGHGMIFTDTEGRLWMAIHSPNGGVSAGRVETPVLVPLKEENDALVWDTLDRGMNRKK